MSVTVKDVMTTHVVVVRKQATFKEMAERLRRHRVSAFPVIDDEGRVIGVVSEADMLAKEALVTSAGLHPGPVSHLRHKRDFDRAAAVTAGDLMTAPPVTISPQEPAAQAARLMYSCRVKRLPVVDAENRIVGIVSRSDVLSVYSRPDAEIAREIREELILKIFLTDPDRFAVTVKSGIVTLEGRPETAQSGRDLVAEAWHVEGVVSVRDRLSYPPSAHSASPGPLF